MGGKASSEREMHKFTGGEDRAPARCHVSVSPLASSQRIFGVFGVKSILIIPDREHPRMQAVSAKTGKNPGQPGWLVSLGFGKTVLFFTQDPDGTGRRGHGPTEVR